MQQIPLVLFAGQVPEPVHCARFPAQQLKILFSKSSPLKADHCEAVLRAPVRLESARGACMQANRLCSLFARGLWQPSHVAAKATVTIGLSLMLVVHVVWHNSSFCLPNAALVNMVNTFSALSYNS